jgi:hypothetical protein
MLVKSIVIEMNKPSIAALLVLGLCAAYVIAICNFQAPPRAAAALGNAVTAELYAIDPEDSLFYGGELLQGRRSLGHTRIGSLQTRLALLTLKWSLSGYQPSLCMFSPRHALRVASQGHTYDFILCYQCGDVKIFEDKREIARLRTSTLPMAVFDQMLESAGVPVTADKLSAAQVAALENRSKQLQALRHQKDAAAEKRWMEAMPKSVRALWGNDATRKLNPSDEDRFAAALAQQYPDQTERLRALLNWLGADDGLWIYPETPLMESDTVPENLMSAYPLPLLAKLVRSEQLNAQQLSGAARYLVDMASAQNFYRRENEIKAFLTGEQEARRILLQHVERQSAEQGDERNARLARMYFDFHILE